MEPVKIALKPDEGQKALLRLLHNPLNREIYIIGSRRRGKSWTVAAAVVRFGIENPTSPADKGELRPRRTEIAIIAPDYERTKPVYEEIKLWFKEAIYKKDDNNMEIILRGPSGPGALIKCWSGENLDSIRGRGYDLVVCDEAAFLNESLMESAVMPTLLDRKGRLWSPSTPKFGETNWWCARWIKANEAQERGTPVPGVVAFHLGTTFDNPRLDPEDVKREIARRDPQTVQEEYYGKILKTSTQWLDHTKLVPINQIDIPGNTYDVILIDSAWGKPRAGQIDKATQRRKNATVIAVIGQDTNGNAYIKDGVWSKELEPHQAHELIEGFLKKYNIKRMGKEIVADDPFFLNWNQYAKEHVGVPHVVQVPFHRGANWKIDGIRYWAGELLFSRRMFIAKDCVLWPHLINEMGLYSEAAAIKDECADDCLTVCSDILQPGIWQGMKGKQAVIASEFDPFFMKDARRLFEHGGHGHLLQRPKRSRYSII
jgi:hypothetical protein